MTNLRKWKKKIAKAKNGEDFFYILKLLNEEIYEKKCYPAKYIIRCECGDCEKCRARWLNKKVEK